MLVVTSMEKVPVACDQFTESMANNIMLQLLSRDKLGCQAFWTPDDTTQAVEICYVSFFFLPFFYI